MSITVFITHYTVPDIPNKSETKSNKTKIVLILEYSFCLFIKKE